MKQFDYNDHNLPPDFSWLEMEDGIWEKVDRKKRKRRFLWLFFFALLGSSAAWSVWLLSNPSTDGKEDQTIIAQKLMEEEVCSEEKNKVKFLTVNNKKDEQLNIQTTDSQIVKEKNIKPITPKLIPNLATKLPVILALPISKLETPTPLLTAPIPAISTTKIKLESSIPWKRIAIYSGLNSFESNIKNQTLSEVNRNDLETSQLGTQLDFRYEWSNKKEDQYWGIGMNYMRLHSRFEYYSEREIIVTRDLYLSPWELLLPREYLEEIYRQVQIKAIEKRRVIHHNSQNRIDFSIYKGVQKKWKAIDLYANLGGRFNLVHWADGKTANTSGEVILLEDREYYRWNLGASLLLEGGFYYPISERLDFSGQFGFQQSLNSWIRKEQLVQQRPRVYWLNFGVSYAIK